MKKFIIPLLFCFMTVNCHKKQETEPSEEYVEYTDAFDSMDEEYFENMDFLDPTEEDFFSIDFFNLTDMDEKNIIKFKEAYHDDPDHYGISESEINLDILLLRRYLEANGYKKVDDSTFNERINQIFEVDKRREKGEYEVIDRTQFFYISFQSYENYSGLQAHKKLDVINNEDIQSSDRLAFVRDYNFIIIPTPVSEFFDPLAWHDEGKLQPIPREFLTHLHLNKYFLNHDRFSLIWLLKNYKKIFIKFVCVYGYDKEPKINKMVLNEILEAYNRSRKHGVNYKNVLNNLFAAKDCIGNLQIREGLLRYILEVTTEEENDFLVILDDYCRFMANYTPEESGFTQSEIYKIIAYTGYYVEAAYIKNDIEGRGKDGNWNEGSAFYNEIIMRGALWEEIKKNDYYGLPGFENIIERCFALSESADEEYMRTHPYLE